MKIPGTCRNLSLTKIWFLCVMMVICLSLSFGTALASGGGDGHGAEPKGWVSTDTYRVMNFAVLAIALFLLLRKPASQALDARIKGIREQLSELESKKKEAEKELADYNEKLLTLDQESEKIIEAYIKQGNEAKTRILKEAESAAQKLEEQAKRNIEHEFKRAKKQLQADIIEKAVTKAEDIVRQRITDEDQERLVDEYLTKVAA
jgi:F-type H+-transporting ATPase subunit b